jgi:hypothetical protein
VKIVADTAVGGVVILDDNFDVLTATTLANFGQVISSNACLDTGLIRQNDTGILSYKKFGDKTQIAYQVDAGYQAVKWGQYESSDDQVVVNLAHPYKIWIVDYDKDLLVGLRHFASPEPIYSLDDPLYHLPLPNTNCNGYNNTSVGWVCLYRTGNTPLISLQEKIQYAFERESGLHEPYNNANMSGTDGPRFYDARKISFYKTPNAWIDKTEKEGGPDWVLRDGMLIPIKVKKDSPAYEHSDNGVPYTFGMALNDPYLPYYQSRLTSEEVAFYKDGWGKQILGSVEFDAKTLNKLQKVEAPKDLNVNELIKSFKPNSKILNFDTWNSAAKKKLSQTIFSMKNSCCFCGKIDSTLCDPKNEVIPFFYSSLMSIGFSSPDPDFPQYIVLDDGTRQDITFYEIDLASTLQNWVEDNNDDENDFSHYYPHKVLQNTLYTCSQCLKSTNSYTLQAFFGSDKMPRRVLTKKGLSLLCDKNEAIAEHYSLYSELTSEGLYAPEEICSFAISRINPNYPNVRHIIGESDLIECFSCGTLTSVIHKSDGTYGKKDPEGFSKEYLSYCMYDEHSIFSSLKVSNCPNCAPKLTEVIDYLQVLAASETPEPIANLFDGVTKTNLSNVLNVNLRITNIVNPLEVQTNSYVVAKASLLSQYYFAKIYFNGSPYFAVDTIENFQNLHKCKCGLSFNEAQENDTCKSCINKDNNFVQLVKFNQ